MRAHDDMGKPGINITYDDVKRAADANGMTVEESLAMITRTSDKDRADHPAEYQSANLDDFTGRVSDSGEGRWTSIAAIDVAAPAPVLTAALYERFTSRGEANFADKVLAAMRFGFGGHLEKEG